MVLAADSLVSKFLDLINKVSPDHIVIEELNRGHAIVSQSMLVYIHHELNRRLFDRYKDRLDTYPVYYIMTGSWRKTLDLKLNKEQKDNNKKLNKIKKMSDFREQKKKLSIKGKIGKKHLSVNYINETFGLNLKMKDDDKADAICLGLAFIKDCPIFNGE